MTRACPFISPRRHGDDKKGIERLLPSSSAPWESSPILLADKPSYTFGVRFADPKRDAGRDLEKDAARTVQEHQVYKDLLRALCRSDGRPRCRS